MQAVLDYLRARLGERTSRVQFVVLFLLALSMTGLVTAEQIDAKLAAMLAVLNAAGPLVAILLPESKAPGGVSSAAVADVVAEVIAKNPKAAALGVRLSEVEDAMARLGVKL